MKIKDMPTTEKPRERLMYYGVENLSNADLLSIILRTGTKDLNVKQLSVNTLSTIGNINNFNNIGLRELSKIKGIGNVKAITILASIEFGKRVSNSEVTLNMLLNTTEKAHNLFKRYFKNQKQEKLMAIYLDQKKRLISYKTLFIGTIDCSIVHPREIFNEAIKNSASAIILIHNHPSNDINPSKEDIEITKNIKTSGKMLGIPLLDHIITNGEEYYSFYEKSLNEY